MNNTAIQKELLSEVRTPAQVLNFALSRNRGQKNQIEILRNSAPNWNNQVNAITNNTSRPGPRQRQQTQQTNKGKEQCWRCGGTFSPGYLKHCAAKQVICRICKKIGQFAKLCQSKISPIPTRKTQPRGAY